MRNEELAFEIYRLRELALSFIPAEFRKLCVKFMGKRELRGEDKDRIIRAYLRSRLFEDKRASSLWQEMKKLKEKLLVQNMDMVHYFLRRYRVREEDRDEAYSFACEGLLRAIDTYEPSRGTLFSTVAYQWINSYMQRFMSQAVRHLAFSLDARIRKGEEDTFMEFHGVEDDRESTDFNLLLDKLPGDLKNIALLLSDGASPREVCKRLNISKKQYLKKIEDLKYYLAYSFSLEG